MEENKKTTDAATAVVESGYEETFLNGTKIKLFLNAEIEKLDEADAEALLLFIARAPKQFYSEVARTLVYEEILAKKYEKIKGTTQLFSKQLAGLKDDNIALLLYYLIHNSAGKSSEEIEVIGKMLSGIAIQSDMLY